MAKNARSTRYDVVSVRKERKTLMKIRRLASLMSSDAGHRVPCPDAIHQAIEEAIKSREPAAPPAEGNGG